jgi:DNA-directed RNA polymerase subunit beta'
LDGLKENVIVGHLIPAGTGLRKYKDILVTPADELKQLEARNASMDDSEVVTRKSSVAN